MSLYAKMKLIQIFNHLLLAAGVYYVATTSEWSWIALSFIVHFFIGTLGITCGYHRLLSHQSYKTSRLWEMFLTVCGLYTTMGSSITWVGLHRYHHSNSDKINDPHSPYSGREESGTRKFNLKLALKGWFNLYNIDRFSPRYVVHLMRDPFHKFIHQHYYKIIWATVIVLGLIDMRLVIFAYAIPACISFHFTASIVVIAHLHGYKTHKVGDESRNSWIASFLTYGDGWHNNHHASPGNWTTQEKWWEIDPCGWFIMLIKND